jgi:hypothetical protein
MQIISSSYLKTETLPCESMHSLYALLSQSAYINPVILNNEKGNTTRLQYVHH